MRIVGFISFLVLFGSVNSNVLSQNLDIMVHNNTNCTMYYLVQGGMNNCYAVGGVSGTINANSSVSREIIDGSPMDPFPVEEIIWTWVYPNNSGCSVTQRAQDFKSTCSNQTMNGFGDGCCQDNWVVIITSSSEITISDN